MATNTFSSDQKNQVGKAQQNCRWWSFGLDWTAAASQCLVGECKVGIGPRPPLCPGRRKASDETKQPTIPHSSSSIPILTEQTTCCLSCSGQVRASWCPTDARQAGKSHSLAGSEAHLQSRILGSGNNGSLCRGQLARARDSRPHSTCGWPPPHTPHLHSNQHLWTPVWYRPYTSHNTLGGL